MARKPKKPLSKKPLSKGDINKMFQTTCGKVSRKTGRACSKNKNHFGLCNHGGN